MWRLPLLVKGLMNFGSLPIVTAWRLTRAGVMCQGIVMDGSDGVRLVVIEDQQIVEWTRFGKIGELRRHVTAAFKARTRAGWVPWGTTTDNVTEIAPSISPRQTDSAYQLFRSPEESTGKIRHQRGRAKTLERSRSSHS
jgi:hypothetical protein